MRALFGMFLVLVACSEPPGITLEVMRSHVRDRVSTVELFVGQHCPGCPRRMAPINQDGTQMLPRTSDMWMVNDPAVFEGLWDGDAAQFRLTSSKDGDEDVPLVVAVGFDGNHMATSMVMLPAVTVPLDHGEHWRAYLEEAKPIVDPYPQDVERIAVWPPQRRGPQCITLEHPQYTGDTLVPFDDTDCDGVAAPECAPFTPNAHMLSPTIENTSCIITAPSTEQTPLCLLGGVPCDEGASPVPPGTTCESHQVDYCVSQSLCGSCALVNGYFGTYQTCVQGRLGSNLTGSGPFVRCTIPMDMNGDACADSSMNEGDIDFGQLLVRSNGETSCKDLGLSKISLPLSFDHDVTIGSTMKVQIDGPDDPCASTLRWLGKAPLDATGFTHTLLADLSLDNGKHMVIPVVLEGVMDCTKQLTCDAPIPDTADSLLSCALPTTDSMTCLGSSSCTSGVACGSHCCNRGESCVDGVCICGDGPHCVDGGCFDPNAGGTTTTGCGIVCCGTPGAPPCG